MQILRGLSLAVLWLLAGVGVLCGFVWGATVAGFIKPLVVISGSMEPGIMTGDLLIAKPVPAETLSVGNVVSLPSALTGDLVTHRIQEIEPGDGSELVVTMKGDNNEFEDATDYTVSGEVWQPAVQIPSIGTAVMRITSPTVGVPLLIGLIALLGITFLTPTEQRHGRPGKMATT